MGLDNLKGFEIVADGQDKNSKLQLVYQVMLFTDTGDYFIILGQASEDPEKYLTMFRNISKSFKQKK